MSDKEMTDKEIFAGFGKFALATIVGSVVALGVLALTSWPVVWLANWLLADEFVATVFAVPELGFWHGMAIQLFAGTPRFLRVIFNAAKKLSED